MLKNIAIADLKYLLGRPFLIVFLLVPVLLVSVLKLIYPLISDLLETLFRLAPEHWFTLASTTIISSIPIFSGAILASFYSRIHKYTEEFQDNVKIIIESSFVSFFVTFSLVIVSGLIANPVQSEGWLRLIYISLLFSLFSIFVLLMLNRYLNKARHINFYIYCSFYLILVPFGLLSANPWNYISFISPLYWINWAWIFPNRIESILAGSFAIIFTGGPMLFLFLILKKKKAK